ncbi:MAG: right-handed parallel beta-helix repeat-containing protein [Phycisphaerales bacterium]
MRNRWIALLLISSALAGLLRAQIHVDDNAPNDPSPYYSRGSDTDADGSAAHAFDSVQKAINAAVDGDTIVVAPGRYLSPDPWEYDEISFKGKSIRLVSSAPTDFAVIEQTVLCGVVIFDGVEDANCLLQGFKIQNHTCGGILGNGTQATVSHCILSGNGPCGATVIKDVKGPIRNCLIADNTTFHDCGVQPVISGFTQLINCTIANNLTNVSIPSDASAHNCIFWGNEDPQTAVSTPTRAGPSATLTYTLVENWTRGQSNGNIIDDPCFVRLGSWQEVPNAPTRGASSATTTTILIEGDYHLRSQGWRWSTREVHGSHWYYDPATSPAVDSGDVRDAMGEELERVPDDPEGKCGFNRAIDRGAYGGTSQASLSPTCGETPGIGAVALADYWPLLSAGNQWFIRNADGSPRGIVSTTFSDGTKSVSSIGFSGAPDWVKYLSYSYADRTFYLIQGVVDATRPPVPSEKIHAQYPEFPVAGSTVDVPYDPFTSGTVRYQTALVVRGTLDEVLAGTSMDPAELIKGPWPDVIAFKKVREDGTAGEPIAIFARGLGPLFIAGYPVAGATVNSATFGTVWWTARRG